MKRLKGFEHFLNEGAYISQDGDIEVSKRNHPENPLEQMKSVDLKVSGFNKRYVSGRTGPHIEVYYGLYPTGNEEDKIPEEYWKEKIDGKGKNETLNTIKTRYMDALKSGDFYMASGETLGDFIKNDIKKKFPKDLDYIVTIESSKGLVPRMGRALKEIYPNASIIELSKIVYSHPSEIFDVKAAEIASAKEKKGQSLPMVQYAMRKEVEKWEALSSEERAKGYKISTSNKFRGSVRKFIAAKYNLKNEAFRNAIYDCLVESTNPENDEAFTTKKMVILDDNTNTGLDFSEIAKGIQEYVNEVIIPLIGDELNNGYRIVPIERNILGYVFYRMQIPEEIATKTTKGMDIIVHKDKAKDLKNYLQGTFDIFMSKYRNRYEGRSELIKKVIDMTASHTMLNKKIEITPEEVAHILGIQHLKY